MKKQNNCYDQFGVAAVALFIVVLITFPSYISAQGAIQCPEEGIYTWHHETDCEKYYQCVNGTGPTLEICPNGVLYAGPEGHGAVYEFCAYRWNVNCEKRTEPGPISSPGCPWQFGIFEDGSGQCTTTYSECVWGVPEKKECHPPGLMYDDRIKGCNWPDQMGCPGEYSTGVSCPPDDTKNIFWPYPRYYYSADAIVTCVNGSPRIIHCGPGTQVDPNSLTCLGEEDKEEKEREARREARRNGRVRVRV